MLRAFLKAVLCYMLGVSFLLIGALALEFVGVFPDIYDRLIINLEDVWIFSFFGVIGVSLAIWDGQFIENVKESHWLSREMKEFRTANWEKQKAEQRGEFDTDDLDFTEEGIDDGEDEQGAKIVVKIKYWCQAANMHTEYLSNSSEYEGEMLQYEREMFEKRISNALDLLGELTDEFYWGAGAHSIIRVLVAAGDIDRAEELFSRIEDGFIKEKILENFPDLAKA